MIVAIVLGNFEQQLAHAVQVVARHFQLKIRCLKSSKNETNRNYRKDDSGQAQQQNLVVRLDVFIQTLKYVYLRFGRDLHVQHLFLLHAIVQFGQQFNNRLFVIFPSSLSVQASHDIVNSLVFRVQY